MDYSIFVEKAIAQDKRNSFGQFSGDVLFIPMELQEFYSKYNPIDVEVEFDIGSVKFYPVDGLLNLQNEYAYLQAGFVFATCNSDPIFLNEEKVYTCPHGTATPTWEKLSDSIEQYFQKL